MGTMNKLLVGAFIAIITAVVLRILLPVPVAAGFAVLFFFLLIQVIGEKFGGGLRIASSWFKLGMRTLLAFVAFVTLRFLLGQILGVYPIDAYNRWGDGGGFNGIFWGHEASRNIVVEVVLLGILGWALWGHVRGRKTAKFVTFALVILTLAGVVFPLWASSWPEQRTVIDESLKDNGLVNTIKAGVGIKTDPTFDPSLMSERAGETLDLEELLAQNPEKDRIGIEQVPEGAWGKKIVLPMIMYSGWCYQPYPIEDAKDPNWRINFEFLNDDGTVYAVEGTFWWGDHPNFHNYPKTFRLQGHVPNGILFQRGRFDPEGRCIPTI